MSSSPPILAVDLGTTAFKAVLIDADGVVRARVARRCPLVRDERGTAVVDAERAVIAAASAIRAVASAGPKTPGALVLSAAMHSVVPIDASTRALGPVRTWSDVRGHRIAVELRQGRRWRGLQERTGTPVHASSTMCKLAWMRRFERSSFHRATAFVSLKELLLRRWLGAAVVDVSLASATGLWDSVLGRWDDEALSIAGVSEQRLSRVVSTHHCLTRWGAGIAESLGLARGTPVIVGASDGALATLGSVGRRQRLLAVTLGTSGAVRRIVSADAPRPPAHTGLFRYVLDERSHVEGAAIDDAGSALAWAGEVLWPEAPPGRRVEAFLAAARRSPPDAGGVTFDARVHGERFPAYDAEASGGFRGLRPHTRREHLARAVIRGVVALVAEVVGVLAQRGHVDALVVGGGVARSDLVRAELERATGRAIRAPRSVEVSAHGAVRLARDALQ